MRIAIYARCSTIEQNPENQLHAIKKYCYLKEWSISHVYVDEGVSGTLDSRPELDRLKAAVKKSKYDAVLVYKFDRLARSTSHLLECLQLFKAHSVDFISISEGVDTSTSVGKMVFTFLGAIAEFEREIISERIKAGLELRRAQGIQLGRPRVGFDVNYALQLKLDGMSWRELAKKVNVSASTLRRQLTPLLASKKTEPEFRLE